MGAEFEELTREESQEGWLHGWHLKRYMHP